MECAGMRWCHASKFSAVHPSINVSGGVFIICYAAGLTVVLHHELSLRLGPRASPDGSKLRLHVPARKLVACRTRELHQSLLLKLGRAGAAAAAAAEAGSPAGGRAHFIAARRASKLDLVRTPRCFSCYQTSSLVSATWAGKQCPPRQMLQGLTDWLNKLRWLACYVWMAQQTGLWHADKLQMGKMLSGCIPCRATCTS